MYIVLSVVTPWSTGVNVSSPINLGPVCLSAFILSPINVAHRGQRLEGSWRLLSTWQQVALQIVLHYRRALSVALAACLSADIPSHEITMIQSILGPISTPCPLRNNGRGFRGSDLPFQCNISEKLKRFQSPRKPLPFKLSFSWIQDRVWRSICLADLSILIGNKGRVGSNRKPVRASVRWWLYMFYQVQRNI